MGHGSKMWEIIYYILWGLLVILFILILVANELRFKNSKASKSDFTLPCCIENNINEKPTDPCVLPISKTNIETFNKKEILINTTEEKSQHIDRTLKVDKENFVQCGAKVTDSVKTYNLTKIVKTDSVKNIHAINELNQKALAADNENDFLELNYITKTLENKVPSYKDLLQREEWLNFREKILYRDHYECKYCNCRHDLQIHHKYYNQYPNHKKVLPWDYPENACITLCNHCHRKVHERKKIKVYYRKYDN